jgi:hypothetical protein
MSRYYCSRICTQVCSQVSSHFKQFLGFTNAHIILTTSNTVDRPNDDVVEPPLVQKDEELAGQINVIQGLNKSLSIDESSDDTVIQHDCNTPTTTTIIKSTSSIPLFESMNDEIKYGSIQLTTVTSDLSDQLVSSQLVTPPRVLVDETYHQDYHQQRQSEENPVTVVDKNNDNIHEQTSLSTDQWIVETDTIRFPIKPIVKRRIVKGNKSSSILVNETKASISTPDDSNIMSSLSLPPSSMSSTLLSSTSSLSSLSSSSSSLISPIDTSEDIEARIPDTLLHEMCRDFQNKISVPEWIRSQSLLLLTPLQTTRTHFWSHFLTNYVGPKGQSKVKIQWTSFDDEYNSTDERTNSTSKIIEKTDSIQIIGPCDNTQLLCYHSHFGIFTIEYDTISTGLLIINSNIFQPTLHLGDDHKDNYSSSSSSSSYLHYRQMTSRFTLELTTRSELHQPVSMPLFNQAWSDWSSERIVRRKYELEQPSTVLATRINWISQIAHELNWTLSRHRHDDLDETFDTVSFQYFGTKITFYNNINETKSINDIDVSPKPTTQKPRQRSIKRCKTNNGNHHHHQQIEKKPSFVLEKRITRSSTSSSSISTSTTLPSQQSLHIKRKYGGLGKKRTQPPARSTTKRNVENTIQLDDPRLRVIPVYYGCASFHSMNTRLALNRLIMTIITRYCNSQTTKRIKEIKLYIVNVYMRSNGWDDVVIGKITIV